MENKIEEVAKGSFIAKMKSLIKTAGPNGEKEYYYESENALKYTFLFRTMAELQSIRNAVNSAEKTYLSNPSNPDISYFLWTGAIVRLCALFDGYYLKHNKTVLENANIELAWKCLKEHRNKDLTHNTNKLDYPKFAFFLSKNNKDELKNRIHLSPKYFRNSYPPFKDAYQIAINLLNRLIYCCDEETKRLNPIIEMELEDKGLKKLLEHPEFEIRIRKSTWSQAVAKYTKENN